MSAVIKTFTNIILDPLLIHFINLKEILYWEIQIKYFFNQHKLNPFHT